MARRHRGHPLFEKGFLIAFGAVLLLIAALFPFAQALDAEADSLKPLYHDVQEMAVLQFREVRTEGEPLAMIVGPEETVQVGGADFTTAEGVSVEVKQDGIGYCVRGRNDDGHVTMWQCHDGTEDPSPRGFSF